MSSGLRTAVSLVALAAAAQALPRTAVSPVAKRQGAAYTRQGCFVDNANGVRLLGAASTASDDMTVATCASFCSSYQYFGLEYGRECWCANSLSAQPVSDAECSLACAGNSAETCGAGDRLDVYINDDYVPPAGVPSPATLADFDYLGCFTDSGNNRALRGIVTFDSAMTLEKCAEICSSYSFFGVEYGSQCFCGVDLDDSSEEVPQAECSMPCGGDPTNVCGAADRLNLFVSTSCKEDPTNLATVGAFAYQSCWVDNVGGVRALDGPVLRGDDMTVEKCADFCDGYQYFGVEYASECFCGNQLAGEAAPEEQCSYICGGDATQWCGAADRLNVYAAQPTTP
ncbi:hypothetical protein VTJ83DRAFT_1939 [Remersonia thermophila]|uniref:WSC domain-containing protein n=1 Tax=Remersonia thermophila TaxID=72144 RepID=A0ABR4DHC7_9PEZI